MPGRGEIEKPFMGQESYDPDNPDDEAQLRALRIMAGLFGSAVIEVRYPGMPLQVFVGTNHAYQQNVSTVSDIRR